jgi:hypothetical protein
MADKQIPVQSSPTVQTPLTGLSKRQQLEKANKAIFVWVAAAAFVCTLSIVALQFIVRQGIFNTKIIGAQQKTVDTLKENIQNAQGLKQNVDALLANQSLSSLRAADGDTALQVILDALPTTGDTTSFSNSLYTKILSRHGAAITGITTGAEALGGAAASATPAAPVATGPAGAQALPFSVAITGNPAQIRGTLEDIEKVIRPIDVNQLNIAAGGGTLTVSMTGQTYFLPRSAIVLGEEKLKP